jgi:NB-ARC domain
MTTPDDAAPQNIQNVIGGAAIQINDLQAPVVVSSQNNTITINYTMSAQPQGIEVSTSVAELPQVRAAYFVGQANELQILHEQLHASETLVITAISGMAGVGKTELALQYAHQQRDAGNYPGGILWLRAREDLGIQIVSFARSHLQLEIPENLDLVDQVAWCWEHWREEATLIVLDDVQTYEAIESFLPSQRSHFKILLTSRLRFKPPVGNYEIQVLSEAASLELLRLLVRDGRIDQDLATAKQLCAWLGYLPLGLELVGRYLARKSDMSLVVLWERLQAKRLAAQALKQVNPGMTASLEMTKAFELSWQDLTPEAQQLAKLLSLFAPAEIPWALVQACLPEWMRKRWKICGMRSCWGCICCGERMRGCIKFINCCESFL